MDYLTVSDLRILITVVSFVVFVGIVYWAYSGRQRSRFDEAAMLPFAEPELPGDFPVAGTQHSKEKSNGVRS
jgi:cytochrome c oxidase cbb3-type subunit 4